MSDLAVLMATHISDALKGGHDAIGHLDNVGDIKYVSDPGITPVVLVMIEGVCFIIEVHTVKMGSA